MLIAVIMDVLLLELAIIPYFTCCSLCCNSCAKITEGDKERLHEHRGTLLNVLVSAIKISFATTKAVQVA